MLRRARHIIKNKFLIILICLMTIWCHVLMIILPQKSQLQARDVREVEEHGEASMRNIRSRDDENKVPRVEIGKKVKLMGAKAHPRDHKRYLFGCDEVKSMKMDSKLIRKANEHGNKAVYTTINGGRFVIKEAIVYNTSDESQWFRYYAGIKEIRNLMKLEEIQFEGFPLLRGKCVSNTSVTYVVDHVTNAHPLCAGNGTDFKCSIGQEILETIQNNENVELSALTWLKKSACFFQQFEDHSIFMEDISGSNFFFSPNTFDITLVDADSLIFYSNISLLSRMSCRRDSDCLKPSGSLWPWHSLNRKIYHQCKEMQGSCLQNTCRGFDAKLQSCGVGHWLLMLLRRVIPPYYYKEYKSIRECLTKYSSDDRCSMGFACHKSTELLRHFFTSQQTTRDR